MARPEPIPGDSVVSVAETFQKSKWTVSDKWYDWLLNLATIVYQCARKLATVSLDDQSGSIGATVLLAGSRGARFTVSVFLIIQQQATTSSSISVAIGATVQGVAYTLSTTPVVNGAAGAAWSQTFLAENDEAVALAFATTYASVGATPLKYRLRIVVESAS